MSISAGDLKSQGNALFGQKNFPEAEKKFTRAIEASDDVFGSDPKGLAVLYANRAACRLSMKRYEDASSDATKATQLDPTYPKAFARLATAQDHLGHHVASVKIWKRALDALPVSNLTTAEQIQKAQYDASMKAASAAALVKLQNAVISSSRPMRSEAVAASIRQNPARSPWVLAAPVVQRLNTQRPIPYSSAWVIYGAHQVFMCGVEKIYQVQKELGAIENLVEGIMYDYRVMHFPSGDFHIRYNAQAGFELRSIKAWGDYRPDGLIREALARQRSEGWDVTRPALAFTIRAWIMQAVFKLGIERLPEEAVEYYKNCLHILRSLRESWIQESNDDRGAIFKKSSSFGIQKLYITAIMKCVKDTDTSTARLEQLLEESELLIREVDEELLQSPQASDHAFIDSFYRYPRGYAYGMKGLYYNKMSVRNGNDRRVFFRKAALQYLTAADCFPEDDEQYPWFLRAALNNMLNAHSFPIGEVLGVMERIRLSTPKAKEIWECSPGLGASGIWEILQGITRQEQLLRDSVAQDHLTMDSCFGADILE
ncbi:hypothetical protein DFH06DRAFT_1465300 [Mycena polygramma]|nr:hypothetical protein DFH06DRAFT_1465300 [Mycena polygramma]